MQPLQARLHEARVAAPLCSLLLFLLMLLLVHHQGPHCLPLYLLHVHCLHLHPVQSPILLPCRPLSLLLLVLVQKPYLLFVLNALLRLPLRASPAACACCLP